MTFSRFPMTTSLELFKDAPIDERLFDNKGILTSRIDAGTSTPLTILNFHTTAGGFWLHPESTEADRIRDRQIDQLLHAADRAQSTVIMAGDLNAGPGVSDANFRSILQAGFVSVHDDLHPAATDYTWQPSNRLNVSGPHHMCPPQRIDHVFIRREDRETGRLIPIRSQLCLDREVVKGTDGLMYSVSDHYGLCVALDFSA
jgi:endonuclease/exonuclease/phosphatase family metal-dependent hydrolase